MTTTLPLFWNLSSASKKDRLDASVKLIGALEQFQAQFTPQAASGGTSSEEEDGEDEQDDEEEKATKSDGLDALNAQDVSYSIRRLVRGLASPRESSRLGFAVALTELLSRIKTVTCSQIVTLILDGTKTQGSMSGQEERDVLFARLFGLTSVIQSGLLVRTGSLETSGSSAPQASTLTSYEEAIKELWNLGEKKSWLRESAWWSIALAVDALNDSKVEWKAEAVEVTLQQLFVENKNWSPEKVALALKLQILYPDRDWRGFLTPAFKSLDLLHSGNFQNLARILKESEIDDEKSSHVPKAATGSWKPQLHFVWDIILDQLLPGPNSSSPPRGSFQEFFRVVVDESLFSSTSSDERKYWGFQVFQKALARSTQDSISMLFTKNFMRSWINHLSHQDRYLHKVARQAATEVQSFVQSNPQFGFALILQLTGVHGSQQFDKLTKTKTIENVLTSMDVEGIKRYIAYLIPQANLPKGQTASPEDIQAINARRLWIVDQFGALVRSGTIPKSDEWVQTALDWLVVNGLFVINKKTEKSPYQALHSTPNPAFSDNIRQACRDRLLVCLADLNSQTTVVKSGEKSSKIAAVASDGEFWVAKVLETIQNLESDAKHVSLLTPFEEEELALRDKALQLAERLKNASGETQEAVKGARMLLLGTVLQQYCASGQDGEEFDVDTLEACVDGVTRMFPEGKKSKKSRKSAATDETALEPIDVLVDTIIGFLEKSTAYMRTVGNQVFALLSGSVKESTVGLIITQLERRDPAELAEDDEDEDEEMEDVEGEGGAEHEDEEASDEDSEDEPSEDEGGDSNDEEEDVELRKRIEEALLVNGIEPATGETDDEEELMDDDQMLAIDEQLAAAFRSRAYEKTGGKSKGVDIQREATHFKNRILDLVDAFVRHQPKNPLVLRFIPPLVDLVVGSGKDERQLSDKAKGILRSRISKSKEVPSTGEVELAQTILQDLHTRARKSPSSDMLPTLSDSSLYLAKVLIQLNADQSFIQAYQQSLADFLTRKNSALNANFFQDFIRRYPTYAWSIRTDLLDLSGRSVNVYRQCQAYQLLEVLITQLPAVDKTQSPEVPKFMKQMRTAILDVATQACEDKVTFTAVQLKQLLKLAVVGARSTQKTDPTIAQEVWQPESWQALSGRLAISSRYKQSRGLREMSDQIARLSKAGETTGRKLLAKKDVSKNPKRKAEDLLDSEAGKPVGSTKTKRKKVAPNAS